MTKKGDEEGDYFKKVSWTVIHPQGGGYKG